MAHGKRPPAKRMKHLIGLRDSYHQRRRTFIIACVAVVAVWVLYTFESGLFTTPQLSLLVFIVFAALAAVLGVLGHAMAKDKAAYERALHERGLTDADVAAYEAGQGK